MRKLLDIIAGWVAERFKAPVLKTGVGVVENRRNPSKSAVKIAKNRPEVEFPPGTQSGTAKQLVDLSKLRLRDGLIHYFLYQQDGSKQPMTCRDTPSNRLAVAWMQIHDAPLVGSNEAP